jgi:hypothetical protein
MALLRVTSSPPATSPSPSTTKTGSPLSLKKVWRYFHRSLHSPSSKHSPHVFHTLPTSPSCPPLSSITPTDTRGSMSLTWSKNSPESLALTIAAVDRSVRIDEGFFQVVKPSYHESTVGS